MSLEARKAVVGVYALVLHTSLCSNRTGLEASNFGFNKRRGRAIRVAKTKALFSHSVTAQLICAIVFAYAKNKSFFLKTWLNDVVLFI